MGLIILFICYVEIKSGESPPCMQRIFYYIKAATGIQLKQSTKDFQSFVE